MADDNRNSGVRKAIYAETFTVGGDFNLIGVPYEKLEEVVRLRTKPLEAQSESQQNTIALLEEKLDLNQRQVRSALELVGESDVPPERLAAKLVEIADRYLVLQSVAATQPWDDARITAFKAEVQKRSMTGSSTRPRIVWPGSGK